MSGPDLSRLPQPLRIITEQPPRRKTTWDWLRDIGITGLILGIISGLIAAVVSAYFQHSRWQVEQSLARSQAELAAASQSFDAISKQLAEVQSLQEILFFTYRAAADAAAEDLPYLAARAREIFPLYEAGRVALRQKMDSHIQAARRHLDWASGWKDGGEKNALRRDPLSYGALSASTDFDCVAEKAMPQSDDSGFGTSPFAAFTVDWRSGTHHLVVFGYCFRKLHSLIAPARFWAGTLPKDDAATATVPKALAGDRMDAIITQLDNQVYRLNRFSALGLTQVERIRRRNAPPGFWAFFLPQ